MPRLFAFDFDAGFQGGGGGWWDTPAPAPWQEGSGFRSKPLRVGFRVFFQEHTKHCRLLCRGMRAPKCPAGAGLVFARQQNHAVGEVEADLVERKIRELDRLRIRDGAIAVFADERRGTIGFYGEFPDLERLGSDGGNV